VPQVVLEAFVADGGTVMADESERAIAAPVERAVWDTIWLVAQLPGMTESYERLPEYGRMVSYGIPTRAAAVLLLEIVEPPMA
jgi:hypothetical protein